MTQHYVYMLLDPKNDLPFYVGKGQGRRAWQHQIEVTSGKATINRAKIDKIKAILATGFDVGVQIVAEYELESDAFEHEIELISLHPTLTNVAPGGGPLKRMSPEAAKRQAEARLRRLEQKVIGKNAVTAARKNSRREKLLSIPGADLHQEQIKQWLDGLPKVRYGAEADPVFGTKKSVSGSKHSKRLRLFVRTSRRKIINKHDPQSKQMLRASSPRK